MAIEDAENDEDGEEQDLTVEKDVNPDEPPIPCSKRILHKVEWVDAPIFEYNDRTYYAAAKVGKF